MKAFSAAALVAVAILATGCSGCAILQPNAAIAGKTEIDERALGLAVTAAHTADLLAEAAVDSGLLKGVNAQTVLTALEGAHSAIDLAISAKALGDATSYAAKLDSAKQLIDQAVALIPSKKA